MAPATGQNTNRTTPTWTLFISLLPLLAVLVAISASVFFFVLMSTVFIQNVWKYIIGEGTVLFRNTFASTHKHILRKLTRLADIRSRFQHVLSKEQRRFNKQQHERQATNEATLTDMEASGTKEPNEREPEQPAVEQGSKKEDNEGENVVCGICLDTTGISSLSCGQHSFCTQCFNKYAKTSFMAGGSYEMEQYNNSLISSRGELPCPYFMDHTCDCHAIPEELLCTHLLSDTFRQWKVAIGRIAVEDADRERRKATQAQEQAQDDRTYMQDIREAVEEALSLGGDWCAHNATREERKTMLACTLHAHIAPAAGVIVVAVNVQTGVRACLEEGPHGAAGCDARSPYLESNAGWENHAIQFLNESRGFGALHEFHRRRMAYFVRQVKEALTPQLWLEFRNFNESLLHDTPTRGRYILWEDVENATPPLFGNTTKARQLRWLKDADAIIRNLQSRPWYEEVPKPKLGLIQKLRQGRKKR
eukprot:CAMPEP_0116855786 /NCGR_PEP_ID=MMETSP0418-20121206/19497_1 /TAXON_ID=1158023 /ORGANISM="Astrosyne radiata, Strain 13vi08-1A" /LENGTH=476 /DNA_ID=CAMNT_0004489009 /DNA_START=784 /DNA_END=2214 /DNA_ORIENTATION=+